MVMHNNPKKTRKRNFLRIPAFPGGKDAYIQFIKENIIYPEQAILNKVEGNVHIVYTVNNLGEIGNIIVSKGIGSGCDEEAIRVIQMMKYEPARNRIVKMKVEMKTRINFKLPEAVQPFTQTDIQLKYSTVTPEKPNSPEPKSQAVYNYTINL